MIRTFQTQHAADLDAECAAYEASIAALGGRVIGVIMLIPKVEFIAYYKGAIKS